MQCAKLAVDRNYSACLSFETVSIFWKHKIWKHSASRERDFPHPYLQIVIDKCTYNFMKENRKSRATSCAKLHFFFSCAHLFGVRPALPSVLWGFSSLGIIAAEFLQRKGEVGTSDQHPGKGCGCAWVGSKWSGLSSPGVRRVWQHHNIPGQDRGPREGLHGCPEPRPLHQQRRAGGTRLFPESQPRVCHPCSFLGTGSSSQLFRGSTNCGFREAARLWELCCHSGLVQRGAQGDRRGQGVVTGPAGCRGHLP